ncbi:MAG: DUF6638 family protein, partial [Rhizobiaceae bacterium]
ASDLLGKTAELRLLIDRLLKEPEAWRDDKMLKQMVKYAKTTGDIRENALLPKEVVFRQDTYWTSHFGGVYVFIEDRQTTVICDPSANGFRRSRPWQVAYIDINDHRQVYRFLSETGRIDAPRGSWIERSGLLEKRMIMLVAWLAMNEDPDVDLSRVDAQWAGGWSAQHPDIVMREGSLPLMSQVRKQVTNWSNIDVRNIPPHQRFLISRANPEHKDYYIVNRLISEYLPFDYLSRFVFNKPRFYADYPHWPANYQEFVVNEIRSSYLENKKQLRKQLYK